MTLVYHLDGLRSIKPTGTFGYSGGFGLIKHGYNRFGFYSDQCGIYHRRRTRTGVKISRMKFYRPTNPQTVPQMAWRTVFATGVSTWQGFTSGQKSAYNERAREYHMTGFNLFMREYLSENQL